MKNLLLILFAFVFTNSLQVMAQAKTTKKDHTRFDEVAAREEAKTKNIKATDVEGYVRYLKNDFYSKKALEREPHKHTPYEVAGSPAVQETVIYLQPNKPMSAGCPNMGFEQYNFIGWTGGKGTTTTGPSGGNPNYSSTGTAIINTAGNNVPPSNTVNYHTIMSLPPVNSNLSAINGYDPNACKAVGTQTISQIPVVSPFSFDPVSVRMGGEAANNAACKLKYITTSSPTNQRLSFSYAVVLVDPSGHSINETPYFKVEVRNEATGAILPGCTSYTFNPKSAAPSDSLFLSAVDDSGGSGFGEPIYYRKWQYYSVDLSTLPSGTNVSLNFEVGSCTLGGHWGYAYVDAECGGMGTPYADMCSGSSVATLVAPTGFTTYQWFGPGGLIAGATNDTLVQTAAVVGTTYSVNMVSPGGCNITQTVVIGITSINIINLNATSSCAGGNSGSASVLANGSSGTYSYSWTNTGSGASMGNTQTVTGLAPGTYSVLVYSTSCGQSTGNISVGVAPPFFISQNKSFCGNATTIPLPGGTNYKWYLNNTLIPAPVGVNDTLYINNAIAGDIYTAVYQNASGCKDSIRYTLNLVTGGSSYFSNTTNVCPSATNGTTIINLNTPFSAPYSYLVTGPTAANTVSNTSTSATSLTLTGLAPGTYTAVIYDGLCTYNNTVTVGVIATNFTITPTNTVLCFPQDATLNLKFGDVTPASCGLSSTGGCSLPNQVTIGSGSVLNGTTNYPSIYGNWHRNVRHQLLYTASELTSAGVTAGKISSLAFLVNSIPSGYLGTLPAVEIKLKCTSVTVLPSTFDNVGLIPVFSGNYTPAVGWNTHNFTTAYEWDGISNILIDICYAYNGGVMYTNNPVMPSTNTTVVKCIYSTSDLAPLCGTPGGFVSTSVNRPNIRFANCGASSPSSYTVNVSSNGTVINNFGNDSIKVIPASPTPPASGSITYTISVINPDGGCVATKTVTILYPPDITTITAAVTNSVICAGNTTTLSASGAVLYNWSYQQGVGGPLLPISTSSSISVTPPALGTNTYVVTGNSPCPTSIPDTKTITVTVTAPAVLLLTPTPDLTKCMNMPFVFNTAVGPVNPSNTGAPYTFSWTTLPGNVPAPGNNSTSSYTATNNTTTTFVVTVAGNCAIPASDTIVVKNFVDDLGIAISNSLTTCPNKAITLNSTTTGGHAVYNYTWTVNGQPVSNTPNLSYTSPPSGGTYTVNVTVMDSCSYQKFDSDIIMVLPNTLTVSIVDSIALCGNTPFTLTSTSSGGYNGHTYDWYLLPDNNSLSNSSTLSSMTPPTEGIYTVEVKVTDSCGYQRSDYQLISVITGCQIEIPNIITPNGDLVNDYFKIKNIEYHPNTRVTIFDRWGLKVFETNNYNNEWKGDGQSDGTFFYVIEVPDDKKYSGFVTMFKGK